MRMNMTKKFRVYLGYIQVYLVVHKTLYLLQLLQNVICEYHPFESTTAKVEILLHLRHYIHPNDCLKGQFKRKYQFSIIKSKHVNIGLQKAKRTHSRLLKCNISEHI